MSGFAAPLAAVALVAAAPVLARPLSPAAFRDRLAAAVSAVVHHPAVAVDDRTFRTVGPDGLELTVSIDNAYVLYLAHTDDLDAILARYTAGLVSAHGAATEPIEQLVVIVRPIDYVTRSLPPGASVTNFIAARPVAGDLSYLLAVDSPTTIRTASKADLARWGVDEPSAWARGVANIKARVGALTMTRLGSADGASGIGASSGLAPSILADPGMCGPTAPDGMRGQVVLVYAKDMLLFAIPADRDQTRLFWRTVRDEVAAGRSMSATPITCKSGQWIVATAP